MNAIARGWQGAVLNLALVVGMVFSPTERVEAILFALFILLSLFTVWVLLTGRRRQRSQRLSSGSAARR
jgi:uncharacterized membrane protein YqjE